MARPNHNETHFLSSHEYSCLPKMIGVRSIDMNHNAKAIGNVRNGNGSALESMDRQRHHPDGDRKQQAAGRTQSLLPLRIASAPEGHGVNARDCRDGKPIRRVPRFGEEPSHRGEDDNRASVISDVRGIESRREEARSPNAAHRRSACASVKISAAIAVCRSSQVMFNDPLRGGESSRGSGGTCVCCGSAMVAAARYPHRHADTERGTRRPHVGQIQV